MTTAMVIQRIVVFVPLGPVISLLKMRETTLDDLVERRVLIELSWSRDEPQVRVRDDHARTSSHVPLIGLELNYRLDEASNRLCLGHRAFGGDGAVYIDCTRPPKPGTKKCVRCSVHDLAFAANIHQAHKKNRRDIDPFFAIHLAKPNRLYLAGFRDGSIKVGTSTEQRSVERLREQGAWLARFVGQASDGFVVREMEDLVTEFVGVAQAVSVRRKLKGLQRPVSDAILCKVIGENAAKVVALIEGLGDERLTVVDEQWTFPGSEGSAWKSPVLYPVPLGSGSHNLRVVDACGRSVVLSRRSSTGVVEPDFFLADIGQLFGWELELGNFDADEIAVQPSLFA